MDKQNAEKAIANCLEMIRLVCLMAYGEDFELCSMYVTPDSRAAWILKENGEEHEGESESEYILNYHEFMEDENDDC